MTMEKVKLLSDFRDYYDHWFDGSDSPFSFSRYSYSGMDREQALKYLYQIGFKVPLHGMAKDLYKLKQAEYGDELTLFQDAVWLVVYLDKRSHRGERKLLMNLKSAMDNYGTCFASEYVFTAPSTIHGGLSFRYLKIGQRTFWLQYRSENDWRSNCGQVSIKVLRQEEDGYHKSIKHPLFAIDFVPSFDGLYAVDFNIAPGVKGTGVEEILPAKAAAQEIKGALIFFSGEGRPRQ